MSPNIGESVKRVIICGLVSCVLLLVLPAMCMAKYPASVMKYKPLVIQEMKDLHIKVTPSRVNSVLGCIYRESGGNAHATSRYHKGILQFTGSWKAPKMGNKYCHNFCGHGKGDWRYCPHANIYRFLKYAKHYHWKYSRMKSTWTTY